MILYCKIAVSAYHNLERPWLTDYNDTKFIVIGWLQEKLWFFKDLILWQFTSQFVIAWNVDFEYTWCDGDLYTTGTAEEFFSGVLIS